MTTESSEPMKIAGYSVQRVSIGNHTLGQVVINKDITVVFQVKDGGGTPGGSSADCLTCKISKISQCANLVCPDIKKKDPNASCSDAIQECLKLACQGSCGGAVLGGGILVLA